MLFLGLLLATLVVYQPAWHGKLLWDDEAHVTKTELRSFEGLKRIWFDLGATQQYYPLTHSTFWVQQKLWGDRTTGYHLTNITLHALAAFLVLLIVRRLAIPGALLAGAIFALHPIHVESVAWISELKNTLSGVLYLAAALAYVRYDDRREPRVYLAALSLFVLALLSKTVTATLPGALLILSWWRRGRLNWRRDGLPLVPFFSLGAAAGLVTIWVERTYIGARGIDFDLPPMERVLVAGRALWFYLVKVLWPSNLIFNYERWHIDATDWKQYVFPAAFLLLAFWSWRMRGRSRAPVAALAMFCVTLVPVLGFFDVFPFRYSFVADHFQYLASIPIITLGSAGLATLLSRTGLRKPARLILPSAIVLILAILSWRQSREYADVETLYRGILARNPSSWFAHTNLGTLKLDAAPEEAAVHLRTALRIRPNNPQARVSLGYALQRLGRLEEAAFEYREVIRTEPAFAEAHNNLCSVLHRLSRLEEALSECAEALRLAPGYTKAQVNLGIVLARLGDRAVSASRYPDAADYYQKAVQLSPQAAEFHNKLGAAFQRTGRMNEAVGQFREAVRLEPAFGDAHFNLANALQAVDRPGEAVPHYEAALARNPDDAAAHINLGVALERLGRIGDAIQHYRTGLRLRPDSSEARDNLARALAARGR